MIGRDQPAPKHHLVEIGPSSYPLRSYDIAVYFAEYEERDATRGAVGWDTRCP